MKHDKSLFEFCEADAPSYAAYDNLRKLASYIDGLKLSQRKVIYTMLRKFSDPRTETKTARLASSVAENTEYLHGEGSLCTVLDTMAASYTGSNNYPLITGFGNFGSRFSGSGSAAAPRYTYCAISPVTLSLIPEVVRELCPSQTFEGSDIEPEFYVPIFPVLFLNGTDGLSSGWKTTIYPRNPKEIYKYITAWLVAKKEGKTLSPSLCKSIETCVPYFKGFKGKIVSEPSATSGEDQFVSYGVVRKVHSTLLEIDEVPITYDYSSFIKVLDKVNDKEDLFTGYDDQCDPKSDVFSFKLHVKRDFWTKYPDEASWIKLFGLQKTLNEQFNCVGEGGRVVEFKNVREILDKYIQKRLEYYVKQKDFLLGEYMLQLETDISKYVFVSGVIDGSIQIGNKKIDEIDAILAKIPRIKRINDSFSYLLSMPMRSMTKETLDKLKAEMLEYRDKVVSLKSTCAEDLWLQDLQQIKKMIDA